MPRRSGAGWGSSVTTPLLQVRNLVKTYRRSRWSRETTFRLEADFAFDAPQIVGVMGANGAGKTTLFELVTGSNRPSGGTVRVAGRDIHRVRPRDRDRLAMHYHQSYQVRDFGGWMPGFLQERADSERALVHLFDEPQFNVQDGYIGFMLDFFRRLRAEGRLVFVCLHPNEPVHVDLLAEVCERFIFVQRDDDGVSRLREADDLPALVADPRVQRYLGGLAERAAAATRR
jgi:ABC-type histidine transport system ATPase subunit